MDTSRDEEASQQKLETVSVGLETLHFFIIFTENQHI